jgi:hypothetical protein
MRLKFWIVLNQVFCNDGSFCTLYVFDSGSRMLHGR